jgi:hypothetical protein
MDSEKAAPAANDGPIKLEKEEIMKAKKFIVNMGNLDSQQIYPQLLLMGMVQQIIVHVSYYVTIMGTDDKEIEKLTQQMKKIQGVSVEPCDEEAVITDVMRKAFDAVEKRPPLGETWPETILMENTPIGTIKGAQQERCVQWEWSEAPVPPYATMTYPVGDQSHMGYKSLWVYMMWIVQKYGSYRSLSLPLAIRLKAKYELKY